MALTKLPLHPPAGTTVADPYGNIWSYDGKQGIWIDRGTVKYPQPVTAQAPGLVTPATYQKLSYLRAQYVQNREQFTPFKIVPGVGAYWYYFRSSDKLFRFTPEGPSQLRIELDRGRLYQLLMKQSCPGIPGSRGVQGAPGGAGRGGAAEIGYTPSVLTGNRLDFAIFTPTPLTTPVSLRIYQATPAAPYVPPSTAGTIAIQALQPAMQLDPELDQLRYWGKYLRSNQFTNPTGTIEQQFQQTREQYSDSIIRNQALGYNNIALSHVFNGSVATDPLYEIQVTLTGQVTIVTSDSRYELDRDRTVAGVAYDLAARILYGSLYLTTGTWEHGDWCLCSRQLGPPGDMGATGESKLSVATCVMLDDTMEATCPIVTLRADCTKQTIYWTCAPIVPAQCVASLALDPDSAQVSDQAALAAVFGALEITTNRCKHIYSYQVVPPPYKVPTLELMHWEPPAGCEPASNLPTGSAAGTCVPGPDFDWAARTPAPACNNLLTWYSPESVRSLSFPWPALTLAPATLEDNCVCTDQFFYCSNVQAPDTSITASTASIGSTGITPDIITEPTIIVPPAILPAPLALTSICLEEYDAEGVLISALSLTPVSQGYEYEYGVKTVTGAPAWRGCAMRIFRGSKVSTQSSAAALRQVTDYIAIPVVYEIFCLTADTGVLITEDGTLLNTDTNQQGGTAVSGMLVPPWQKLLSTNQGTTDIPASTYLDQNVSHRYNRLALAISFPVCPTGNQNVATSDRFGTGQGEGVWTCSNFQLPGPGVVVRPWVKTIIAYDVNRACDAALLNNPIGVAFQIPLGGYSGATTARLSGNMGCSLVPVSPVIEGPAAPTVSNMCPPPGQSCGEILFTGISNTGNSVATNIVLQDPLGITVLHPLTLPTPVVEGLCCATVWRGCNMRVLAQAWTLDAIGERMELQTAVPIPVLYDLYCDQYPGDVGRPAPASLTEYPAVRFKLRLSYPVRFGPSEVIAEYTPTAVNPATGVVLNCVTCIPGIGPCPPGSSQHSWYYPNFSQQAELVGIGCTTRPLTLTFNLGGPPGSNEYQMLMAIFGTPSITVQIIESGMASMGSELIVDEQLNSSLPLQAHSAFTPIDWASIQLDPDLFYTPVLKGIRHIAFQDFVCMSCLTNFYEVQWTIHEPLSNSNTRSQAMALLPTSINSGIFYSIGELHDANTGITYKVCNVLTVLPASKVLELRRYFYYAYRGQYSWGTEIFDPTNPVAVGCGATDVAIVDSSAMIPSNNGDMVQVNCKFTFGPLALVSNDSWHSANAPTIDYGTIDGVDPYLWDCIVRGCYVRYIPGTDCAGATALTVAPYAVEIVGVCPRVPTSTFAGYRAQALERVCECTDDLYNETNKLSLTDGEHTVRFKRAWKRGVLVWETMILKTVPVGWVGTELVVDQPVSLLYELTCGSIGKPAHGTAPAANYMLSIRYISRQGFLVAELGGQPVDYTMLNSEQAEQVQLTPLDCITGIKFQLSLLEPLVYDNEPMYLTVSREY